VVEGGDQTVDPLVLIRPMSITFLMGWARPASSKENSQEGTTKERGYAVTQAAPLTRVREPLAQSAVDFLIRTIRKVPIGAFHYRY